MLQKETRAAQSIVMIVRWASAQPHRFVPFHTHFYNASFCSTQSTTARSLHSNMKTGQTQEEKPVSRVVFCGNLSFGTTWKDLRDHMRQAGEIVRADVLMDSVTGRSKGCGIVKYADAADARKAIRDLHETQIDGRQIYLREDRGEGRDGSFQFAEQHDDRRVYVGNLSWGKFRFLSQKLRQ